MCRNHSMPWSWFRLYIHTSPLPCKTGKDGWEYIGGHACFGVRVPINLNPRYSAPYDHNARPSHTDRQTDRQTDRRTNITTIARRFVLTNASRAKKLCIRLRLSIWSWYSFHNLEGTRGRVGLSNHKVSGLYPGLLCNEHGRIVRNLICVSGLGLRLALTL